MTEGFWNLYADPAALDAAKRSWSEAARAAGEAADSFAAAARRALSAWEGEAADSFAARRAELVTDLDLAASTAGEVANALQVAAGSVRSAQGQLDLSWATIMHLPHSYDLDGRLTFLTETDGDRALVVAARESADDVRASLDQELVSVTAQIDAATRVWTTLGLSWTGLASGAWPIFRMPFGAGEGLNGVGILEVDGEILLTGGEGNESITVTIDPATGEQIITVTEFTLDRDGVLIEGATRTFRFPGDKPLTIRGGGGDDIITLPKETSLSFTVIGGDGDDRITAGGGNDRLFGLSGDDTLEAGAGDDYLSGGGGADYLNGGDGDDRLFGGDGRDTLYGLGGDDWLSGGTGVDYLEGGEGADVLSGGAGADILSGGRGDDLIDGGAGDDVSYGGLGTDRTIGGSGTDTSHDDARATGSTNENNINIEIPEDTAHITIEGSPEFIARVQADLDMLRSSPAGQQMLANLEHHYGNSGFLGLGTSSLKITEWVPPSNAPFTENSSARDGAFTDEVRYLPTIDDFRGAPPVVVLQHELAHVYDFVNDTFDGRDYTGEDDVDSGRRDRVAPISIAERQATGLPIDHDDDPSTPEIIDPDHPIEFTENGLRDEMNLPPRTSYR